MSMTLEYGGLTSGIIGAAIEVHKTLGPGFLESIYENALLHELSRRGIRCVRQREVPVHCRDAEVGLHRLDLLVEEVLVVELKSIAEFRNEHFAVVRSYLRATGLEHGLLLNFGRLKLDVRRVSAREQARALLASPPGFLVS